MGTEDGQGAPLQDITHVLSPSHRATRSHHRQSHCPSSPPEEPRTSSSIPLGCASLILALITRRKGTERVSGSTTMGRTGHPNAPAQEDRPAAWLPNTRPPQHSGLVPARGRTHGSARFPHVSGRDLLPRGNSGGDRGRKHVAATLSAQHPVLYVLPSSQRGLGSSKVKTAELRHLSITLCRRTSCADFHGNSADFLPPKEPVKGDCSLSRNFFQHNKNKYCHFFPLHKN